MTKAARTCWSNSANNRWEDQIFLSSTKCVLRSWMSICWIFVFLICAILSTLRRILMIGVRILCRRLSHLLLIIKDSVGMLLGSLWRRYFRWISWWRCWGLWDRGRIRFIGCMLRRGIYRWSRHWLWWRLINNCMESYLTTFSNTKSAWTQNGQSPKLITKP